MYSIDTDDGLIAAMNWTENHLKLLNTGGLWIIPRSLAMYRIDHEAKTATGIVRLNGCWPR